MPKISVNINDETYEVLTTTRETTGVTATEQIRRAVSLYKFLTDAQRDGKEIHTVTKRGKRMQVYIC